MKGYFNTTEQTNHLIFMSAIIQAKSLLDSNGPTEEEKKFLKKTVEYGDKFSQSVFNRLGEGYKRSLYNKSQCNTLRLVSKGAIQNNTAQMEDYIEKEFLCELLNLSADIDCEDCKRTDCKKCGIYKIKSYLNYDGKSEENDLCPFRKEKAEYKDIDFDL